jgi:hypothetical protein
LEVEDIYIISDSQQALPAHRSKKLYSVENNITKHWKVEDISDGIKHMDRIDHEVKTIENIVGLSNRGSGGI